MKVVVGLSSGRSTNRALTCPPPAPPSPPNKRQNKPNKQTYTQQNEIYTYLDTDDNRILEVRINLHMYVCLYVYIPDYMWTQPCLYTQIYPSLSLDVSLPAHHQPRTTPNPPIPPAK